MDPVAVVEGLRVGDIVINLNNTATKLNYKYSDYIASLATG